MLRVKICWYEGRDERCTEGDIIEWNPEQVRSLIKGALRYCDEPIPEGLLKDGEKVTDVV